MPEYLGKCLAKATLRFIPGINDGGRHRRSGLDLAQGSAETPQAAVGMKSQAVMGNEPAPHRGWIDVQLPDVLVLPAFGGVRINRLHQPWQPVRVTIPGMQRLAAPARAKPGGQGLTRRGEEINIGGVGRAGGATRPAEYTGGFDRREKYAVKAGIIVLHGFEHGFAWR